MVRSPLDVSISDVVTFVVAVNSGVVIAVVAVKFGNVRRPAADDANNEAAAPGADDDVMACVWLPVATLVDDTVNVPGVFNPSVSAAPAPPSVLVRPVATSR